MEDWEDIVLSLFSIMLAPVSVPYMFIKDFFKLKSLKHTKKG